MKPIAITMGDSSGVGPEIILKAFREGRLPEFIMVCGDTSALDYANRILKYDVRIRTIARADEVQAGSLNVVDLGLLTDRDLVPGQVSSKSGAAALSYVRRATEMALAGEAGAMVTMPIHKEATRLTHPRFTGHTEFIAEACGVADYTMMLASEKLIVTHVSTHVSLADAIRAVKADRVRVVIGLTHDALKQLRPRQRIAVAGLNPHAGENGAFGAEDRVEIGPAVAQARADGMDAHGPCAADTVFKQAIDGWYDAVVCMYHDQGHIPLKLLDFEGGVNVTLGLPIIRTSVDHGTAFDIAYQGRAFTRSLESACRLAVELARRASDPSA